MNVRLNKDQKIKLLNSDDVYSIMQQILMRENKIRRNQEHFWVIGLDNRNKILFIELIGLGRVNRVNANPPDVFRMGIYKLAVQMILVHNHPSGEVDPSTEDRDFTDRMLKVGKLINIEVLDHLVISETSFTSFKDDGIMDELSKSGLFEIVERKKALEIAKKLKDSGMDDQEIKKMTNLPIAEIREL